MHEKQKLAEAEFFLERFSESTDRRREFEFYLSAWLSAARSVLQYALEEACQKKGGQAWYDSAVGRGVVGFFKDTRDINIHGEPIKPRANVQVMLQSIIRPSASLHLRVTRANGTVEEPAAEDSTKALGAAEPIAADEAAGMTDESAIVYRYYFPDWTGSEDVVELGKQYLTELRSIVQDGIARGFLDGSEEDTPDPGAD